jgi:putative membrane protein
MRITTILAAGVLTAMAFSSAYAQDKPDADSQKFIKNAIEGNIAEIDAGKLAEEKSKSAAVKEFGAMLVKDHGEARAKAEAAAKALNVDPPTGSSIMQKGAYAKLKLLQGDTFDRSFASTMVSDHEADIKEYEKISVKDDAVGKYAKEALPVLKHHLEMAQKLKQEVAAPAHTGSTAPATRSTAPAGTAK